MGQLNILSPQFASAFRLVIGNEGGYSDDARDPGGETMWGITARVAVQWGYMGPMRQLSQATAQQIAYAVYWEPYSLDALPFPIAFNVFDGIYNGGPAVKWLQEAVGGLVVDGNLGPITVAAVKAGNLSAIVGKFNALRLQYLTSLATWETFGKGWANRIANNLLKGLST